MGSFCGKVLKIRKIVFWASNLPFAIPQNDIIFVIVDKAIKIHFVVEIF
jgi:hypothetical protein